MLKVQAIGNLGREVELRYTGSGTPVASFSIAVTERYKDKSGQQQESTEWVNCTAWDRLATLASEYLHKGSKVYIEGKLKTTKYTANDGGERYKTEVVIRELEFLSPRGEGGQQQEPYSGGSGGVDGGTGEDVPF